VREDDGWWGLPGKAEPLPLLYTPATSPEHLPDAPIMLFDNVIWYLTMFVAQQFIARVPLQRKWYEGRECSQCNKLLSYERGGVSSLNSLNLITSVIVTSRKYKLPR
jgi:hypothetical protein